MPKKLKSLKGTYFIKTFGCQMNVSDSERIAGFLEAREFTPAKDITKSDFVIFNTCGVRKSAEDRVYGQAHNLSMINKQRSRNDRITVILTGCLANRKDVQRKLKDKIDLFCEIKKLPKELRIMNYELWRKNKRNLNSYFLIHNSSCRELPNDYLSLKPKYKNTYTAYVPIMTGCNNFCSYCVVPYARGREISRPTSEILDEIKKLIRRGYKEIVLLGQNVNSYHYGKTNFSQLLKKVNAIPGHFWIWFVSNHPKDFTDELIATVTKCRKVCECVHLPIQAGDDKILKKMNRQYSAKNYLDLMDKIKQSFARHKPGMPYSITSDIIVGFPGETKKRFFESARIMEKVKYDMVYFGQFSPRPGTAAWKMKDSVKKIEKEKRENYLNEILKKTTRRKNQKYLNKNLEVLIEKEKDGSYFGRTRTMKNVKISSPKKNLVGKFVKVKITKANVWSLEGKAV